jgi:hypothetical protein
VPTLIRLLDDERLTRFVSVGFNNFPPWILRVQHVAGTLLQELAGEDLGKDWLRSLQGSAVTKEAAAAWWMRARAAGEETWLRGHVLPTEPQGEWPNRTMLDLLAARYPHRLAEVYRAVLAERPHVQSWPIVAAIVRSGLDTRAKTELLLLGAGHDRLEHRRAALWKLKELDPGRFRSVLMATLQATPRTPATPYWSCREAAFAHLVIETADDAAWRTLLETARRVDVGLRLELLAPMAYAGKPHRERRVAFLAAFLDDPALRDAARDFAATQLAAILDLPGERPDAGWSASQWAAFRGRVRALLEARPRTAPAP